VDEHITQSQSPEFNTHSFIIKIWIDDAGQGVNQATWRGHITHVPSGERRYLKKLDDILSFMETYLEALGVEKGPRRGISRWLNLWKK